VGFFDRAAGYDDEQTSAAGFLRAQTNESSGRCGVPKQRTADALEHILDQVLGAGSLPVEGGEKPHLTVVVDLDQLGVPNEPVGAPGPGARGAGEKSSFAPTKEQVERAVATARAVAEATSGAPRYAWTGPASREAARRLSCDGVVLPIFTRGGEPVDVGRRTRIIPAALRALIVARDRHCRWPGCPLPVRWTEIHHLVHWRDGGPTDRTNLALLCALHHKAAHGGGFTVIVNAPGDLSVRKRLPGDPLYEVRAARGAPSDASGAVR
jgi:hypothetical protein